jgi:putative flippase GtrA
MAPTLANALGFAGSAQLNYLLSALFTWGDRRPSRALSIKSWLSYNATVLIALTVNTAVFAAARLAVHPLVASLLGVIFGAAFTYSICNFVIFRSRKVLT